jgi:hypothetical protein
MERWRSGCRDEVGEVVEVDMDMDMDMDEDGG